MVEKKILGIRWQEHSLNDSKILSNLYDIQNYQQHISMSIISMDTKANWQEGKNSGLRNTNYNFPNNRKMSILTKHHVILTNDEMKQTDFVI